MLSYAGSETHEREVRAELREQPLYRFIEGLMGVGR